MLATSICCSLQALFSPLELSYEQNVYVGASVEPQGSKKIDNALSPRLAFSQYDAPSVTPATAC